MMVNGDIRDTCVHNIYVYSFNTILFISYIIPLNIYIYILYEFTMFIKKENHEHIKFIMSFPSFPLYILYFVVVFLDSSARDIQLIFMLWAFSLFFFLLRLGRIIKRKSESTYILIWLLIISKFFLNYESDWFN